jgi:hypothetical protein
MKSYRVITFVFTLITIIGFSFSYAQEGFLGQADTEISNSTRAGVSNESSASGTAAPAAGLGSSASASQFPWQGRVTAAVLNARTAPWGAIKTTLKKNDSVTVTAKSPKDSKWLLVNCSKGSFCVSGAYIARTGSGGSSGSAGSASSGASEFPFQGRVNASIGLNARKAPWGAKVTSLKNGTSVNVTGRSKDDAKWYSISHSGRTLYCHSAYIVKGGQASSGGSTGGSTGGGVPTSNPNTGKLSTDILSSMASLEMKKLSYPSPCAKTVNGKYYPGWLGCAFAVSKALNLAGVSSYSLGVNDLSNKLQKKPKPGFVKVATSSRKPGDVVIWNPSHIGVIKGNGRAYSNSSSNGCVREHSDTYMPVRYVLRAPA